MKLKQPQTAWIFDVDGVLTDPEAKRVTQLGIFTELIKRMEKGELVGLNTGRSLEFLTAQISNPLESLITNRSILQRLYVFAEMGAIQIIYTDIGEKKIMYDQKISVPSEIREQIRTFVNQKPYQETMFFDETKQTMISIELKPGKTVAEFENPRQQLVIKLNSLLQKHHLDHDFRVDPTRICTDVENVAVSKALGVKKFVRHLEDLFIEPHEYIAFGDSSSDLEMWEELKRLNKAGQFVYVGDKQELDQKYRDIVTITEQRADKGTLEFLLSR